MADSDGNFEFPFDIPWTCSNCGEVHEGMFDLAWFAPDFWPNAEEYQPNSAVLNSTHFLSEDFCVIQGTHYFIRCNLELRLTDRQGASFRFGVWSSLFKKSFEEYLSFFDTGENEGIEPWLGRLSNQVKGYPDTLNMECRVHPQAGRTRPKIKLEPIDHPLVKELTDGISTKRLLEIYQAHGHQPVN